ncbi:hypothetical protein Trydic_g14915, partial [Trypoxylus dichotomus]
MRVWAEKWCWIMRVITMCCLSNTQVSTTHKIDMVTWLDARNIPYDRGFTKPELYEIIKRNEPTSGADEIPYGI